MGFKEIESGTHSFDYSPHQKNFSGAMEERGKRKS
jgi:hypothetical protein